MCGELDEHRAARSGKGRSFIAPALVLALFVSGNGPQQAMAAEKAPRSIVGASREHILTCMGFPASNKVSGNTETLSYEAAIGDTAPSDRADLMQETLGAPRYQSCKIDVVLSRGRVSRIQFGTRNATQQRQCALLVENCLSAKPGPVIYKVVEGPQRPGPSRTIAAPPPVQPHTCTHAELVQARIAKLNGYTAGPKCD